MPAKGTISRLPEPPTNSAGADASRLEAALLKTLLAERDLPCPVCGYNLHACESAACPECGARLELRIGSIDLKMGLWLVALLCVAIPVGLIATVSIIMFIAALDGAFSNGDLGVMWTCWGILAAQAVLLALLIWKRRAFWRQSRVRRLAWMSAFTLASAALTVAFIWFILSLF